MGDVLTETKEIEMGMNKDQQKLALEVAKQQWPQGYTEILEADGSINGYISADPSEEVLAGLKAMFKANGLRLGKTVKKVH